MERYKGVTASLHAILFFALLVCNGRTIAQNRKWTLSECIERALLENVALNQDIVSAGLKKIDYAQARLNVLPNLNFNDQHSFTWGKNAINPNTDAGSYASGNNAALNSAVTLFNGFKNTNSIKYARLSCEAADFDVQKLKNDLILNVLAAYLQVLFQYEAVGVAQAQIDATSEHLAYTARYVKAGSLPESSLLQMQAQLASDRAAKVDAENQLLISKVTLTQLIELPLSTDFDVERSDTSVITIADIPETSVDVYNTAIGFLPEIRSASLKTNAAAKNLSISRADLLPKITLAGDLSSYYSSANSLLSYQTEYSTAHIGYLANDPSAIVDGQVSKTTSVSSHYPFSRQLNDNFSKGITINMSVPVFNNQYYRNTIRRSEIAVSVARLNESLIKNQVRKSIELAYTDLLTAGKNYVAAKEQLTYEETSFRNITIKFRAGAINATDYYVEKTIYNKSQMALLQAKYQYRFKAKLLDFYLGKSITN
jgi:outer membrane protein